MALPTFYEENLPADGSFLLSELTSRHLVQVLRMKESARLLLTNGKGQTHLSEIVHANKKATEVRFLSGTLVPEPSSEITIAISLIKNKSRFEWFLEKATEIGVQRLIPIICDRSEAENFRHERMHAILVSAMLQSQQAWLPQLDQPMNFADLIASSEQSNKFIAHCLEEARRPLSGEQMLLGDKIILIGPEGDFTAAEVALAIENNFLPVSLGTNRLRTETAGIVACVLMQ